MSLDLYLLWLPKDKDKLGIWGVYTAESCPDPYGFPKHIYRKYTVSHENWDSCFNKLAKIQQELITKKIVPTENNYNQVFPALEEDINGKFSDSQ
jgi:hypothetical protein